MVGIPNGWQKFIQEDCANNSFKQHKSLTVLTGKISNITVLDFDNDPITGTNCYEELVTAFPELRDCKTIKTWSGGYHIYCQYDPEIATGTNVFNEDVFPNMDIRNEAGMVFSPPTKMYHVDLETNTKTVKGEYVDYIEGDTLPFPLELKKLLKQFHSTSSVIPTKKRTVSDMLQQGTHDDSVIISDEPTLLSSSSASSTSSSSSSSSSPVAKIMRIELDAARLAEYQSWNTFLKMVFPPPNTTILTCVILDMGFKPCLESKMAYLFTFLLLKNTRKIWFGKTNTPRSMRPI